MNSECLTYCDINIFMLIYIFVSILTNKIFLNFLFCKIKKDVHGIVMDGIFFQ